MAGNEAEEVRRQAQRDRLLDEVRLHRMRRDYEAALKSCQKALALQPGDAAIYELAGDILDEQGRISKALEAYQHAHKLDPQRASVEEKIGRLTLEIARSDLKAERLKGATGREEARPPAQADQVLEQVRRQGMRPGYEAALQILAQPEAEAKKSKPRHPAIACVFSLLLPGAGQIYNRDYVLGLVFLILGVVFLAYPIGLLLDAFLSPGGDSVRSLGVWDYFWSYVGQRGVGTKLMMALSALGFIALYLYSAIHAPLRARQIDAEEEDVLL